MAREGPPALYQVSKGRLMIELLKQFFFRALHNIIILTFRPYVRRELPGWGKVYSLFVGGYERNWFWENAPTRVVRGKMHKYLMSLDLSRWSDRSAFFLGRWYALDLQMLMFDIVKSGDTIVDVGTNRGMFSFTASYIVGKTGKVFSFEPNPNCLEALDQTISMNKIENIFVNRCGLASKAGELTLSVPLINWGEGTFGKSSYSDENTYQIQVDVKIGDNILKKETPTLIKIDVEGFEYNVIQGLQRTIKQHHPIIITEIVAKHLKSCGTSVQEIKTLIESMGYTGFKLNLKKHGTGHDWELKEFDPETKEFDAVWLHPDILKSHAKILTEHGVKLTTFEKSNG